MSPALRQMTVIALLAALPLAGCDQNTAAKTPENDELPVPVELASVIVGPVDAAYQGTATLEAAEEAVVVAHTSAVVEEIRVEEGARVQRGEVLAQLDARRLRLEAARAKAELDRLASEHRRNQALLARKLLSLETFERVKYQLASQKAAYDLAQLGVDESRIRAPFDGVVSERLIKIGNMVQPDQPAFRVTRFEPLLAVLHVPERQIRKLATGQQVSLRVDVWPDEQFRGSVLRINPVVSADTGTVKLTIAVQDPQTRLKPGMFVRVGILYDRRPNALLVPKDAVMIEDGEAAVYVVADGVATRTKVRTGYSNTDFLEITDGLREGQRVVTTGQATLKDGAKVEPIKVEPKEDGADEPADGGQDGLEADASS